MKKSRDTIRMNVFNLMQDGVWRTKYQIQTILGGDLESITARLRDLRKGMYGSHEVNRRRYEGSEAVVYEYQLIVNQESMAA